MVCLIAVMTLYRSSTSFIHLLGRFITGGSRSPGWGASIFPSSSSLLLPQLAGFNLNLALVSSSPFYVQSIAPQLCDDKFMACCRTYFLIIHNSHVIWRRKKCSSGSPWILYTLNNWCGFSCLNEHIADESEEGCCKVLDAFTQTQPCASITYNAYFLLLFTFKCSFILLFNICI